MKISVAKMNELVFGEYKNPRAEYEYACATCIPNDVEFSDGEASRIVTALMQGRLAVDNGHFDVPAHYISPGPGVRKKEERTPEEHASGAMDVCKSLGFFVCCDWDLFIASEAEKLHRLMQMAADGLEGGGFDFALKELRHTEHSRGFCDSILGNIAWYHSEMNWDQAEKFVKAYHDAWGF